MATEERTLTAKEETLITLFVLPTRLPSGIALGDATLSEVDDAVASCEGLAENLRAIASTVRDDIESTQTIGEWFAAVTE